MSITLVLDINGVLADVRKKNNPAPHDIPVDLVIPSGQKVYMRPQLDKFFNFLHNMQAEFSRLRVVLWTSRKQVNAEPIEQRLGTDYDFAPSLYMHGEDCREYRGYHPLKEARIVRERMHLGPRDQIVFVDDSPDKIKLDAHSQVLEVKTFNAGDYADKELIKTVCVLYRIINNRS